MRKHLHLFVAAILFPLGMIAETVPSHDGTGKVISGTLANKDLVIEVTLNSVALDESLEDEVPWCKDFVLELWDEYWKDCTKFPREYKDQYKTNQIYCKHSAQAQYWATIDDAIVNALGGNVTFNECKYSIKELIVKGTLNLTDYLLIQEMAGINPYEFQGEGEDDEFYYKYENMSFKTPTFAGTVEADELDAALQDIFYNEGRLRTITLDNISPIACTLKLNPIAFFYGIDDHDGADKEYQHYHYLEKYTPSDSKKYPNVILPKDAFAETKLEKIIIKSDKEFTLSGSSVACIQNPVNVYLCAPRVHSYEEQAFNSFRNADGKIDYAHVYSNYLCDNVKIYAPINSICELREHEYFACDDGNTVDIGELYLNWGSYGTSPKFTATTIEGDIHTTHVLPMLQKADGYNYQTFSDFRAYDLSNVTGLFDPSKKIDSYYITEFYPNAGDGFVRPVLYNGNIMAGEGIMFNVDKDDWFPLTPIKDNQYETPISGNLLKASTTSPHIRYDETVKYGNHGYWMENWISGTNMAYNTFAQRKLVEDAKNIPIVGKTPDQREEWTETLMNFDEWADNYLDERKDNQDAYGGLIRNHGKAIIIQIGSEMIDKYGQSAQMSGAVNSYVESVCSKYGFDGRTESSDLKTLVLNMMQNYYSYYNDYQQRKQQHEGRENSLIAAYNHVVTDYRYDGFHTTDIVGDSNTAWYGLCDDEKFVLYFYDKCDIAGGYSTDLDRDNQYSAEEMGYIDEYIPEHRAYLDLSTYTTNQEVKAKRNWYVDFGSEITGIKDVTPSIVMDNAYYNLSGQRVAPNTKGILIHNGKKVFNK